MVLMPRRGFTKPHLTYRRGMWHVHYRGQWFGSSSYPCNINVVREYRVQGPL